MKKVKMLILQNKLLILLLLTYSFLFTFFIYFYYQRLGAFGCFDDCFYYMGGYFLLKGERIYTDFFFNHSFLVPVISFLIQKITHPTELYTFILFHKLFIYLFSFLFGLILIFRFKTQAFLTLIFYELTKFFTFGDRFLGESLVVYPVLYLLGISWEKIHAKKLHRFDYLLSGIFVYFIIFAREPYVPLALFLFLVILWGKKDIKLKKYAVISFLTPAIVSFILISPKDFFTNVFTLNKSQIETESSKNGGILGVLIYPLRIYIEGFWNLFRQITIFFMSAFLISGIYYSLKLRRLGFIILLIALSLAAVRPEIPGTIFYKAYHMNIWYAVLLFSTFLVIFEILKLKATKFKIVILLPFFLLFAYIFTSPNLIINEKINKIEEYNFGYSGYYVYGNAIKNLSSDNDTIFVEEKDELINVLSNLKSSYKYNGYTSFMPLIDVYRDERLNMFKNAPPDFYYDACYQLDKTHRAYTPNIEKNFTRIYIFNKPSCLLINNKKINNITDEKWKKIKNLGFQKPEKTKQQY